MQRVSRLAPLFGVLFVGVFACDRRCVVGTVTSCSCADGKSGEQACTVEGTAGRCVCAPAAGADGGATAPGNDAGTTVSLAELCAQLPLAVCQRRMACGEYSDAGLDVCLTREETEVEQDCRRAKEGTFTFNGSQAAACLERLRSAAQCFEFLDPCGGGVFSTRAGACGLATCGADNYCDNDCQLPRCHPFRQPGEPCSDVYENYAPCDRALGYCHNPDGGATSCQPWPRLGERCASSQCGPMARCDTDGADSGCVALLPDDAACTDSQQCLSYLCRSADRRCGVLSSGMSCVSSIDCSSRSAANSSVCLGLRLESDGGVRSAGVCSPQPKLGEACSRQWAPPLQACDSLAGLACLDGTCKAIGAGTQALGRECPLRPWGLPRVPYTGFLACEPGLSCQPTADSSLPLTGRCQPVYGAGAPCQSLTCAPGLTCMGTADGGIACQQRLKLGMPCPTRGGCLSELACFRESDGGYVCLPPRGVDAGGCEYSYHCVDGAVCDFGVCKAKPSLGEVCARDYECGSGLCGGRRCVSQCKR